MGVVYWYSTGHHRVITPVIVKALVQYAWRADWIKIGITNNPERRFAEHQRQWQGDDQWQKMVVVYHSRSWRSVCAMERLLIEYARGRGWVEKLDNYVSGGGGRKPRMPPYWLYFLTA